MRISAPVGVSALIGALFFMLQVYSERLAVVKRKRCFRFGKLAHHGPDPAPSRKRQDRGFVVPARAPVGLGYAGYQYYFQLHFASEISIGKIRFALRRQGARQITADYGSLLITTCRFNSMENSFS